VSRAGSDEVLVSLVPRKDESHGSTEEVTRGASGAGDPDGVDLRRDPATRTGALRRVGEQLGTDPETLRNWVGQAEVDDGQRPGIPTAERQRIAELERENRELRRANEILKAASAFFASELDRPRPR
jgi:transposase